MKSWPHRYWLIIHLLWLSVINYIAHIKIRVGPCDNLPCPDGAQCNDTSNSTHPQYDCKCQMGLVEEGGRCIGNTYFFKSMSTSNDKLVRDFLDTKRTLNQSINVN